MLFSRGNTEQGKARLSVACAVSAHNLLREVNVGLIPLSRRLKACTCDCCSAGDLCYTPTGNPESTENTAATGESQRGGLPVAGC